MKTSSFRHRPRREGVDDGQWTGQKMVEHAIAHLMETRSLRHSIAAWFRRRSREYDQRRMLAVHLKNRRVDVKRVPRPRPREGFALIRLLYGGICATDLELQRGYHGFSGVPGHEFVGEVVVAGNANLLGRRVVGEINLACGRCDWCRVGLGRHCPRRAVLGIVKHPGAFREFLTLPEANLHVVPASIPTEAAVFVEPLAAACEILDQVQPPAGSTIAVLGDGKLGLLVSQTLAAEGFDVHLFGRHRAKLQIARRAGVSTERALRKLPRASYDWVVEATGSAGGLGEAVSMTRPRGTIIMKSTLHGDVPVDTASLIVNEISLVGSRCGRFEPAIELLRSNRINVADMVSDAFPLSQARRAFARAAEPGVLKVLLQVEE